MKIRLKFMKTGPMKFIGHLDFVRTFQKIFRKSGIPIAFTEGFSPHPIFSIAAPLAVGVTSEGDYLDLELTRNLEETSIVQKINSCCPNGLKILMAIPLDKDEPAAMGIVSACKYIVEQKDIMITNDIIEAFSRQETIIISKKTKKGNIKEIDIKPGIFNLVVKDEKILLTLAAGSTFNIKPEVILQVICGFNHMTFDQFNYKVHRLELYYGEETLEPLSTPIIKPF